MRAIETIKWFTREDWLSSGVSMRAGPAANLRESKAVFFQHLSISCMCVSGRGQIFAISSTG
jgi:hypothetical protein